MPWYSNDIVTQRKALITDWQSRNFTVAALARRYGISRKTANKWINVFKREGIENLQDRSRARRTLAHRTPDVLVNEILVFKCSYPEWGPKTIHLAMYRKNPVRRLPAVSTIGNILKRHGLVKSRKRQRTTPPHNLSLTYPTRINKVWGADVQGDFRAGDGKTCYPLTISDLYSRYLLACQCLENLSWQEVQRVFERVFQEYGLPDVIRTDNGWPFATSALGGLSPLAVWLLQLGVLPERIAKGCPQQNGRHERLHRTLKAAVAKPPAKNFRAQQRAYQQFRKEYNEQRPHQALERGQCPSDVYRASTRSYAEGKRRKMEYPSSFILRKVRRCGCIKWRGRLLYASKQLHGHPVGLKEIGTGRWQLYFGPLALGIVNDQKTQIQRPV